MTHCSGVRNKACTLKAIRKNLNLITIKSPYLKRDVCSIYKKKPIFQNIIHGKRLKTVHSVIKPRHESVIRKTA